MRFIRTVSVKHHGSGDHFQLSIPAQVAQAICLEEGGLVSIEVKDQAVSLQAYRDSGIAWREQLRPGMESRAVAVPPRTLGPSKPWGRGKITDWRQDLREIRASFLWINAEFRKTFPRRRGRSRRRW